MASREAEVDLGCQLHVGHLPRQDVGIEGGPARRRSSEPHPAPLLGQVRLDLLALGGVDVPVGPGRRHHGAHQEGGAGIQRIALQGVEGWVG